LTGSVRALEEGGERALESDVFGASFCVIHDFCFPPRFLSTW
jgi:hypothetical protein